jgi:hypothetical protein
VSVREQGRGNEDVGTNKMRGKQRDYTDPKCEGCEDEDGARTVERGQGSEGAAAKVSQRGSASEDRPARIGQRGSACEDGPARMSQRG